MADWKSEARNLPTWPGAFAYFPASEVAELVVDAGDGWAFNDSVYETRTRAELVALALDHPDTQAAYLRRLAIRLGCPEEVAGEGVTFARESASSPKWWIAAGASYGDPSRFIDVVRVDTDDRLLALVRAWRMTNDG